jgi:hypothetical protein
LQLKNQEPLQRRMPEPILRARMTKHRASWM